MIQLPKTKTPTDLAFDAFNQIFGNPTLVKTTKTSPFPNITSSCIVTSSLNRQRCIAWFAPRNTFENADSECVLIKCNRNGVPFKSGTQFVPACFPEPDTLQLTKSTSDAITGWLIPTDAYPYMFIADSLLLSQSVDALAQYLKTYTKNIDSSVFLRFATLLFEAYDADANATTHSNKNKNQTQNQHWIKFAQNHVRRQQAHIHKWIGNEIRDLEIEQFVVIDFESETNNSIIRVKLSDVRASNSTTVVTTKSNSCFRIQNQNQNQPHSNHQAQHTIVRPSTPKIQRREKQCVITPDPECIDAYIVHEFPSYDYLGHAHISTTDVNNILLKAFYPSRRHMETEDSDDDTGDGNTSDTINNRPIAKEILLMWCTYSSRFNKWMPIRECVV